MTLEKPTVNSLPPTRHAVLFAVPNVLSALRLVLAAAFFFLPQHLKLAAIIVAGVSDLLDGLLARALGVCSWAGGLLDAIADKCFVLALVTIFAVRGDLTLFETILLLQRDFCVLLAVIHLALIRRWDAMRNMPARLPGKLTTAAMFLLFIVLTLWPERNYASVIAIYITAALSTLAGFDYAEQFARAADRDGRKKR